MQLHTIHRIYESIRIVHLLNSLALHRLRLSITSSFIAEEICRSSRRFRPANVHWSSRRIAQIGRRAESVIRMHDSLNTSDGIYQADGDQHEQ
ncbi:hypothetical protein [Chromobacterium subtsugae]|uniref:hypothetical protein n=1 Tax=Chromobacterium subtsugae TaxID=251747 RepID=UPI00128D827D|nr:hypothetical protein [Chromobacterium subtsugae]